MENNDLTLKIAALGDTLRTFTRRFTHDADESSDLLQETMLKALLYKDKFRADNNLKGWLFTIMRNTYINGYRKNQLAGTIRDRRKELYFLEVEDKHTFSSPESKYEYNDVWKNINELRDELKVPFKMHTSGYKYHEIAVHLGLPIGTVKNRIFHARKEIQEKLVAYRTLDAA